MFKVDVFSVFVPFIIGIAVSGLSIPAGIADCARQHAKDNGDLDKNTALNRITQLRVSGSVY